MTISLYQKLPDNTPVIIGAGQHVERLNKDSTPPFNSPMHLGATACQLALVDAGVGPEHVDTIAAIRLFSDSVKTWASPFGGSNNPPESIARHIGASVKHRIYSNAGGNEPLQLLMEMSRDIARGEKEMVLLAGAEAIASQRFALRNGFEADWHEEFDAPLDNREYLQRLASAAELNSGMRLPAHYYALIENFQAHQLQHTPQQHRHYMAQLMAPFSIIASANPYAQTGIAYTAAELAEISKRNYAISLPYSKFLIAQDAVNQAAAVLLTSVGNARRLGVNPAHWVFLEAYAQGMDRYLSQRENPGHSVAMERVLGKTMDMAGATPADMDLIDIYSCFPCAVHSACETLNLPTDGSLALTVTGGLPYFGGPGNNYSMHALAEMAVRLRQPGLRGLVTANGGFLSKHAAAVLSANPVTATNIDWLYDDVATVQPDSIDQRPYCANPQQGEVITYTVIFKRGKEDIGIVMAETAASERFLASTTASEIAHSMQENSPIGRRINVHQGQDGRQLFSFQD